MFNDNDLLQFRSRGIAPETVEKQILHFRDGFPFASLAKPATVEDGIFAFPEDEVAFYEHFFNEHKAKNRIIKFVPASGAASRMFKHLFEFRDLVSGSSNPLPFTESAHDKSSAQYLLSNIRKTAFYEELSEVLQLKGQSIDEVQQKGLYAELLDAILEPDGLNYAALPKALLLFHKYPMGSRTAAEEHLVEAALYATDNQGNARIHFTISPEHRQRFDALINRVRSFYEEGYRVWYDISFSIQEPSTDTVAVDEHNLPFRNADGSILFRPGGHGALITNLNNLDADLIFIKNIDNIVPDRLKEATIRYKKVIGGYLLFLKERIFSFLEKAQRKSHTEQSIEEITKFLERHLFLTIPELMNAGDLDAKVGLLVNLLNRPLRVCGMVRNAGEPGGGPFWVRGADGVRSLQIIESSQVDLKNPNQKDILSHATHFNPVDLVCYTRNFEGKKFNLHDFVDENAGFISIKSSGGRVLKAQELPGLWNGAMARWLTAFVEVPLITFNPVKTVNDLLRDEHMGS